MTEKSVNGDGSGGGDGGPAEEEKKKNNNNADGGVPPEEEKEKEKNGDPELLICLLQPAPADSDPDYIGIRRLLLSGKPQSPFHRRRDWRCNGKGYVAFRNYIRRPRNWERMQTPSLQTTPGNRSEINSHQSLANLSKRDEIEHASQLYPIFIFPRKLLSINSRKNTQLLEVKSRQYPMGLKLQQLTCNLYYPHRAMDILLIL